MRLDYLKSENGYNLHISDDDNLRLQKIRHHFCIAVNVSFHLMVVKPFIEIKQIILLHKLIILEFALTSISC